MVRVKKGAGIWLMAAMSFGTIADAMVSFSRRGSRYFAVQHTLPPLSRHMPSFNQTETLPYSSSHGQALPVLYTNNPRRVSDWLADNIPTSNGVIGFDIESVPRAPWIKKKASFQGPATVQLATTSACLVVHLTKRNGRPSRACAPILDAVLGDGAIVKAGVGIHQDMIELWHCWQGQLQARSRLDISGIGLKPGYTVGLQRLASTILGVELGKSKKQTVSDWSQVPLTDAQLIYSARDAWVGAAIVDELAQADPDTFGTAALLESLKSEISMEDMMRREQSRKQAKAKLSSVLKPYVPSKKKRRPTLKEMPEPIKVKVKSLKRALAETSRDAPLVFDVEPLGFKVYPEH